MDDFKIIIYILAAVAYFLFSQWRKAFSGDDRDDQEEKELPVRPRTSQPSKPVTSFEDILRELQPKMQQAEERGREVVRQQKERSLEEAGRALQQAPAPAAKYKSYEDAAPKVLSWEKRAEAIEAAKKSKLRGHEHFKPYDLERLPKANRYGEMLRNPATAREAFVLSEIFKRKYE
ncbi:hypothetical protein [Pontibacter mangrovi]|uniref:Uncharacterized protein n=1 Tax=Pontibacter mangrovi TaxID=2589816 RepID=A0A501W832_9BACT|nr:hypothetical protein [Pontibacter mangrovi]TPE45779.1 hypothetical protein FJM65_00055 [Pontibacter mangrovi]